MADAIDTSILWSPVSSVPETELNSAALKPTRNPSSELDKNAFLQLLITQMKYQDPLSPMDDKDFLGQMAQFTALEQMQNLNATYAKTQAYSMIGKSVQAVYQNPESGEYEDVSGLVTAVTVKSGEVFLNVEGKEVPMSSVQEVADDYFTSAQLNAIYDNVFNTRNQGYVGNYIQALLLDKDGNVTEYVEGKVDYVKFDGVNSVLVVGNKEVFPGEVASVSQSPFLIGKAIGYEYKNADGTAESGTGTIYGVNLKGNKPYLQFENGREIAIDKINYIMEAMAYVGKSVEHEGLKGEVTSVTIKNGIPFLNMQGGAELSYLVYKGL